VPKSKDAPSLFELLGEGKTGIEPAPEKIVEPVAAPPSQERAVVHADQESGAVVQKPRTLRVDGDRIRFALSSLHLALVIFAALLVVVLSYQWGRRGGIKTGRALSMQSVTEDEMSRLRRQEPEPGVLENLNLVPRRPAAQRPKPPAAPATRQQRPVGLNYVWIETVDSAEDAANAQRFLADAGVSATVHRLNRSNKWVLISKQGFDFQSPQQKQACEQLQNRIKAAGLKYAEQHGGYNFQRCYARKKKESDSW
jgi:hypothetical protein